VLERPLNLNALGANTWNTMPTTAIIMATNTENANKVRLLLETGRVKNINQADGFGRSPLFVASENGCYEIAKILLKYGADPKLPPKKYSDGYGATPLDVAKNHEMRELLRSSSGLGLKKIKKPRKTIKKKLRKTNKRKKNSKQKK
jgi:ankyrin repeat protein